MSVKKKSKASFVTAPNPPKWEAAAFRREASAQVCSVSASTVGGWRRNGAGKKSTFRAQNSAGCFPACDPPVELCRPKHCKVREHLRLPYDQRPLVSFLGRSKANVSQKSRASLKFHQLFPGPLPTFSGSLVRIHSWLNRSARRQTPAVTVPRGGAGRRSKVTENATFLLMLGRY